jgi:hypothetical protein
MIQSSQQTYEAFSDSRKDIFERIIAYSFISLGFFVLYLPIVVELTLRVR